MIKTFDHKGLEKFFYKNSLAGIQAIHAKRLRLILTYLNEADKVEDMGLSGFRLHPLKGKKKGLWAVSVSGNWRITFKFEYGDAYIVDYLDYH